MTLDLLGKEKPIVGKIVRKRKRKYCCLSAVCIPAARVERGTDLRSSAAAKEREALRIFLIRCVEKVRCPLVKK